MTYITSSAARRFYLVAFLSCFLFSTACTSSKGSGSPIVPDPRVPAGAQTIPIGGNTWLLPAESSQAVLTDDGIVGWSDNTQYFETYARFANAGTLQIWLNVGASATASTIAVIIGDERKEITITAGPASALYAGEWQVTAAGYAKIILEGVARESNSYPNITSYSIAGSAVNAQTAYVKNNEDGYFYWGRRGPSVHMRYDMPSTNVKWFYNEVTVPDGNDIIGSFYMANGFTDGYFGMQANSPDERRILFSVWSPFTTDNPNDIPEHQRIKLLKKGTDVYAGEFGNEGSGGQSYLRYDWKAGNTYRFLLSGEPVENNHTLYTAWFFAPELGEWRLIASFSRPETSRWLGGFHSFLENFSPLQGIYERQVYFGNQWTADENGHWVESTQGIFTADATARIGYRLDYDGGIRSDGRFFLRNCGFFPETTAMNTTFTRPALGVPPGIDFSKLP